jgi:RloB-like protein
MARRSFRAKSRKELKRRGAIRDVPDRVLIVTEGSKTEPDYFRRLIAELGLRTAQIRITGDGGSAPVSVVKDGLRILQQDPDFEQVYFVFDRDRHDSYDGALDTIRGLGKKRVYKGVTIVAATSVPCFEIWFMMHVDPSRKPYESAKTGGSPGAVVLSDLKKTDLFSCYEKGECAQFDEIEPFRDKAKSRADSFLTRAQEEGAKEFHENPSTRVHLVVGALETLSKVNKKI